MTWKILKIVSTVVLVIVVLFALAAVCYFTSFPKLPIGLIDDTYYTMSPRKLNHLLGPPESTSDCMAVSAQMFYDYTVDIDGIPVQITCGFLDDWFLYDVRATASVEDTASAYEVFQAWKAKIYESYEAEEGFYCNEIQQRSDTDYSIDLGINLGATGISCTITAEENVVHFRGTYQF